MERPAAVRHSDAPPLAVNLSLPRSVCNYLTVGSDLTIFDPSPIERRDIKIQIDIPAELVEFTFIPVQPSSLELIFLLLLSDFTDFRCRRWPFPPNRSLGRK
ncbi:hypothetical protein Rcae01_03263 [Novipirellula caenicola]|uniref:Uncharacterized protein n=1 Tax=Novipirellula caenicola TaxID=1536901 RepID=A0ABP9VT64_9BACT